ncbi:MAG: hypothetical protein ABL921_29765 [Pirellula sp.]
MAMSMDTLLNPKVVFEILFRHKFKIIFVPILVALVAIGILLFVSRTYRSEAKLFLQIGKASVGLDPTATTGQTVQYLQSGREGEIKSAIDVIGSGGLLGKAIDKVGVNVALGIEPVPGTNQKTSRMPGFIKTAKKMVLDVIESIDPISDREKAISEARDSLSVEAERESTVLVITYDADSPELAQHTLNAIVETYEKEHARIHQNQESLDFFDEQKNVLKEQLDDSIARLRDAKSSMGLGSILGRRDTLEFQLKQVRGEVLDTEQQLASARARVDEIKGQLTRKPDRIVTAKRSSPNTGRDMMRETLYQLQVRQKEVLAKFTADHPQVVTIGKQIADARRIVDDQEEQRDETVMDISMVHQQLSLELAQQEAATSGLISRLTTANKQTEDLYEDIRCLNNHEVQLELLDREVELNRERFVKYSKNVEEARIDRQLSINGVSDISILQAATLTEKPISPSKILVLAGGLLLATFGTLALILASELVDTRIRSSDDLHESLGLPVLAVIPENPAYATVRFERA